MNRINRKTWIILLAIVSAAILFLAVFFAIRAASKQARSAAHAFPVCINEILVSNGSYPNRDGVFCDCIELYNSADETFDLSGYQLSDKDSGTRFVLPKNTYIEPHGYLLIHCSKDMTGPFYADFGLSRHGGEDISFLNPHSAVLDTVHTLAADKDVSQGLDADRNWTLLPYVTLGYANTREGFLAWQKHHTVATASDVVISEIMASNTIYRTAGSECTDWIELQNRSNAAVALDGYGLSDDGSEPIYRFPQNTVLEAGAYLVVPCTQTGDHAAHFGLSKSGGEDVTLFDARGAVADSVHTVPSERNQSYARGADDVWDLTFDATPGFANTPEGRAAYVQSIGTADVSVHITELMADNQSTLADATGGFHDWVELTNTGDAPCTLAGWFLSDDADDPTQWRIPDRTLDAGESLLVFFAKNRDGEIDGELFAPMALSAAGDSVYLVDPLGSVRETVTFGPLDEDRSLVIDPATGEQTVCGYPTPACPDTPEGYAACSERRVPTGALAIWEVMSANDRYLPQSGEYYDWVELKNVSQEPINLSAYSITDDSKCPDRFRLPDVTLQPNAFYVLILSGHTAYSGGNRVHASFALNAQEDRLFLYESERLVDYVHLYRIPYRRSYGRNADRGGFFYMTPTPEAENTSGTRTVSADPVASLPSGVYGDAAGIDVTLSANGTIYYTTDCSDPSQQAAVYTGPIHLDHTTVLRAIACEPDQTESPIVTLSYLINEPHDLPVVSLVTAPWHLWDSAKGIYINGTHRKEIEYPASAAYFGPDGTWAKECGLKMHGSTSMIEEDKKSFTLKFSGVYGGPLHYDIYGDGSPTVFKSVILRADNESVYATFLRDNVLHRIARQYSPTMLSQNYKYVVLYLNGAYWGIYAIREQYTPFFYASHLGVPEDTVTILKNGVQAGTGLGDVLNYVSKHDLSVPEHYAYVEERLDLSSLIDWTIFQAYCGNFDIAGNIRYLHSSVDGKWRLGLVDIDLGFFSTATFSYPFKTAQLDRLLTKLFRNGTFRARYLARLSELLSDGLSAETIVPMLDEMAAAIRSEIPNEKKRWGGTPNGWEYEVATLRAFFPDRARQMIAGINRELTLTEEERRLYFSAWLA